MSKQELPPFWETTPLRDMTREQWESVCDRCSKCCLLKLQDEEDESVYFTSVVCDYFDEEKCQCADYQNRSTNVPDCLWLDKDNVDKIDWLPSSCSYLRLLEGRGLPKWHHLVVGHEQEMHQQGKSIQGRVIKESHVHPEEIEHHIVMWPVEDE